MMSNEWIVGLVDCGRGFVIAVRVRGSEEKANFNVLQEKASFNVLQGMRNCVIVVT